MKNHSLFMMLCCLIPAGVLIALLLLGVKPATSLLISVALLCPLLLLYGVHRANRDHEHHS